jgi:hypothetical protein
MDKIGTNRKDGTMKKLAVFLVMVGLFLASSSVAQAGLINAGFETGNLTGWTASNPSDAAVVTSHGGDSGTTYLPPEGSRFLQLLGSDYNSSVSQEVSLLADDVLSGWAAFDWRDYPSYYDWASVSILDVSGAVIATPWSESGSGQVSYWDGPWTQWSWTASSAGDYTLVYAAGNTSDTAGSPYALFDAQQVGGPVVPEPASLLLLGSGLLGLAGIHFRKVGKS